MGNDIYMNYTIWQPETDSIPWSIHMQGWRRSGIDIWLYHEQIKGGYCFYKKVKIKNANHFAEFIRKQLSLFKTSFKKDIAIRGIDYVALLEGYKKGEVKARSYTIDR